MAGAMRKMAVYLGLVEDDEHYDEYDEYYDEVESPDARPDARPEARYATRSDRDLRSETRPESRGDGRDATRTLQPVRDGGHEFRPAAASGAAATTATRAPVSVDYRITTLHPRTYNDARALGEAFREGTPVIMNLTEMDDVDAKRIVDFSAGLVFGLHGTIERVTQKVFLLSPNNVTVTAEQKQRLAEGGFFNQS
jgi:cell division inhibitor SepF